MKKDGMNGMIDNITLGILLLWIATTISFLYLLKKRKEEYNNTIAKINKGKKRLHHRTKNSMQVMISLLDMQAFKTDNPHYQKVFSAHVDRLKSMSILYDYLYMQLEHENINTKPILQEIIESLQKSTSNTIKSDIDDTIVLNMQKVTTIALILNESLANAIKYAYKEEDGKIEVNFKELEQHYSFSIIDKGIGFDTQNSSKTLGLKLIASLVQSLPNSTLEILSNKENSGTQILITFEREHK